MKNYLILSIISVFLFSGCTWVSLTSEGELVQIFTASEVADCKSIGQATVSVKDKVAGVGRSRSKVEKELLILGQNSAAEMGGDAVVSVSGIQNGEQSFDVYKCRGDL
jgi:hypothetical protein